MKKLLSFLKCDRKTAAEVVAAFLIGVSGGWIHVCFGDSMAWGDYVLLFLAVCGLYCLYALEGWKFTLVAVATFFIGILSADASVRYLGLSFGFQIKLASFALFVSGAIGLYLLYKRTEYLAQQTKDQTEQTAYLAQQTKNQAEQTAYLAQQTKGQTEQMAIQIRGEIDNRFRDGITLLGNDHTSARTGAIYSLCHLAVKNEKYRMEVPQILCSHIRSITGKAEYQDEYRQKPSDEIRTAINMLFKQDNGGFVGLYPRLMKGEGKLERADLSGAYLVGAKFVNMDLQCALFTGANCVNACFWDSNCQRVNFRDAAMQGAWFLQVNCQGASFQAAHCQFMKMDIAKCHFANFAQAQCQDAPLLSLCQFGGANFSNSGFQDAYIVESNFYDAFAENVGGVDLGYGVNLSRRIGRGTKLQTVKSAGEVPESDIARIQKMQPMLSAVMLLGDTTSIYVRLQEMILKNAGRSDEFVFPEVGNPTGAAKGKAAAVAQRFADELALLDDKFLSDV